MRNMKTVKDNLTVLRKDDGELTTADQETADLISAYFKEVCTVEDLENFAVVMGRDLNWKDTDLDFGVSVVMKKLQQLNSDKSPSPDAVYPLLLKECAAILAEPLSMIFQQSFEARTLPADWKTANIVAIFKKGDRTDRANYRPVSLTSVPCKIMESIIKESCQSF